MKHIYRILLFVLVILFTSLPIDALYITSGEKGNADVGITVVDIARKGHDIVVTLDLDLSHTNMKGNREIILTPMFVNGLDTVRLESFSIAGRNRWYYAGRNGLDVTAMFKGYGRKRGEMLTQSSTSIPASTDKIARCVISTYYLPWMENALLMLEEENRGCASCEKGYSQYNLAATDFAPKLFEPQFLYITPEIEEEKIRQVTGRAYIDFKVNETSILPSYRRNSIELAKIMSTIDSVRNDADITVTSLTIKGTASPEGPYENNVRLARGRTDALAEYVRSLYRFPRGLIRMDYEPVDWEGLADWLRDSDLEYRYSILNIVEGSLPPEQRNDKIRTNFPKEYAYLLEYVYPTLRHSDYAIEFTIRSYNSVEEILRVMETSPQKLSLDELFRAAKSQPEGSDIYTEAMEIAVRMYPDDEAANLNAAISAIKHGDISMAEKYLNKAGDSDEVIYQKAVILAIKGQTEEALKEFTALSYSDNYEIAELAADAILQLKNINNSATWRSLD